MNQLCAKRSFKKSARTVGEILKIDICGTLASEKAFLGCLGEFSG